MDGRFHNTAVSPADARPGEASPGALAAFDERLFPAAAKKPPWRKYDPAVVFGADGRITTRSYTKGGHRARKAGDLVVVD
jgi:hypothetical protein